MWVANDLPCVFITIEVLEILHPVQQDCVEVACNTKVWLVTLMKFASPLPGDCDNLFPT